MSSTDTTDSIPIQTSGLTAFIATDYVGTAGITGHYQLIKLAYGVDGSATMVNSSNPLPVSIAGGLTATISGFTGIFYVQGVGGAAVNVSGTVVATGITSSPIYVRNAPSTQIEITGGIPLSRSNSSISVWGPSGNTWIYANLVGTNGSALGVSGNPFYTVISGATLNVTVNPTVGVTNDSGSALRVQGFSGGTAVTVGVTGSVNVNDTNILNSLSGLGVTLNSIYTALSVFGLVRPSSSSAGIVSATTGATYLGPAYACTAGVNVKSLGSNTDLVYLGNTYVGTSFGYQLEPGESIFLNVGNVRHVLVMSKSGTQTLSYFAS